MFLLHHSFLSDYRSLQTLVFTVAPLVLPRLYSFYRTQRILSQSSPIPLQPVPRAAYRALNVLFFVAFVALVSTIPSLAPENIFTVTSSRLQTPNDVLFTRLSSLRPGQLLSNSDRLLKPRLASLEARCLYLTYGPDVLTHCPFCVSDEPTTYFYYALPSILLPHFFHLFALGMATSGAVSSKYGSRWRTIAVMMGAALALGECYVTGSYDGKANARALRPEDLDHFYWRMRTLRGITICVSDAAFAALLWAASTNRIFALPPASSERTETAMKVLENARGRLSALGILRNAAVRDNNLRRTGEEYWKKEGVIMEEVMGEREVVEGVRSALSGRIPMAKVEKEASMYAEGIVGWRDSPVPGSK